MGENFITIMKNLMMNLLMEMITSTTSTSGNRSKDLDTFQKTNQNQSLATILTQVGRPIMTLEEQGSERNLNQERGSRKYKKQRNKRFKSTKQRSEPQLDEEYLSDEDSDLENMHHYGGIFV